MIMSVYLIGRELPLYGVNLAAYDAFNLGAEDLIMQTIGGDRYKTSIFALGISPFMFSTLIVQMIVAMKNADSKAHTSPKKTTMATLILMLCWATIQAVLTAQSTFYIYTGGIQLLIAKIISTVQMITGAFIMLWLATRNGKYGLGGQTILIYVNILDGIVSTLQAATPNDLRIVGSVSVFALIVTIVFENSEYRIPMQRISIHSIYSDKNYIPIKLNPIGMMPVMFSSAFFMLPVYICSVLKMIFPHDERIIWAKENMDTNHPLGIAVYIIVLYVITIIFAFIFISPKNIAESLQKSGDSIRGLRAGKKTKSFINKRVFRVSVFSAFVMSISLAVPLGFCMQGWIESTLISLPSITIAMASITCNLYREYKAVLDYDAYVPFI
jgi:preprotein translocase subunit SecY